VIDAESAVHAGRGQQLAARDLFALPGVLEQVVVFTVNDAVLQRSLGPEQARHHPVGDIAGRLGVGQDHQLGDQCP